MGQLPVGPAGAGSGRVEVTEPRPRSGLNHENHGIAHRERLEIGPHSEARIFAAVPFPDRRDNECVNPETEFGGNVEDGRGARKLSHMGHDADRHLDAPGGEDLGVPRAGDDHGVRAIEQRRPMRGNRVGLPDRVRDPR